MINKCNHGQIIVEPACSDCVEAQLHWQAKASECATLSAVEKRLRERAGVLFGQGKDDLAEEVRNAANEVAAMLKKAEEQRTEAMKAAQEARG